jgi:hypothetical protein
MAERLKFVDKMKVVNADSRKVGRRVHAEKRLVERFGLDYVKVKHVIENGGAKVVLDCETNNKKVCLVSYMDCEIYFILFHGQISTFLTKEMVEKSYPEIFEPPKEKKKVKEKRKLTQRERQREKKKEKRKRKLRGRLIPASELFEGQ